MCYERNAAQKPVNNYVVCNRTDQAINYIKNNVSSEVYEWKQKDFSVEFAFVYRRLLRCTLHCICLLCLLFELVLVHNYVATVIRTRVL